MCEVKPKLSLDLHCHLERDEDIPLLADLVAHDLDVLAITNHSNKRNIVLEQSERIEKLAALRPDLLLIFGMEWNLYGTHANILFPKRTMDASYLRDFLDDFEPCNHRDYLIAALECLAGFPGEIKPILCLNHPAHPNPELSFKLAKDIIDLSPPIPVAVDGFHGHQGWSQKYADPFDYPGSALNGLCDFFYMKNRRSALLAGSDFHPNKQKKRPDYPPGVFQRVLISGAKTNYARVFSMLTEAKTTVVQNKIIHNISTRCKKHTDDIVQINITVETGSPAVILDIISGKDNHVGIVKTVAIPEPGTHSIELNVATGHAGYIRIRGRVTGTCCCQKEKTRTAAFITSAVFLE